MSSDDYARTIIQVGHDMGVSVRGIKIALATALVETNLKNYANRAVPGSLTVPYDAIGSDSKSVGLFQQQPQWWGRGDGIDLMDPATSARLFYEALTRIDYNGSNSPGSYAQAVQRSSFPDRYDQRFAEASALYDRLNTGGSVMPDYGITKVMHGYNATSVGIGNSNGPRAKTPYFVVHTQQAKSTAVNLANFCNGTATTGNPVAYNLSIDGKDTVEIVPISEGPWAAADANNLGIHVCIAGSFAQWSRGQWLDAVDDSGDNLSEDLAITRAAKALAAAHQQYGIPLVYGGDRGKSGWPIKTSGVVGHMDFGNRGGGHTDPGMGFPFDELIKRALTAGAAPVVPNLIDAAAAATPWVGDRITKGENKLKDGAWAEFTGAHIYWKNGAKAAYVIPHGGLFETWGDDYQWETGPLGYPTRPYTKLPEGAVQAFEHGTLLRKDGATQGFYVHGAIGDQYKAMGWEESPLGYPVSNEEPVKGSDNIVQRFEHGTLTYVPTGVKVELTGKAA
jgi:hypothetical protein